MEFNRNQYFMLGLVVLFVGLQLRFVETFVLNERTTQFINKRMQNTQLASSKTMPSLFVNAAPIAKKPISPPRWVGFSLMSIGSVLVLHSLAMKKPGG